MSSETSKASWIESAKAAVFEIEAAFAAYDIDQLMYLNNAKKEIEIAIQTRSEQK